MIWVGKGARVEVAGGGSCATEIGDNSQGEGASGDVGVEVVSAASCGGHRRIEESYLT